MQAERSLVLLKPDAVRRGLVGQILARYEAKGLSLVALELRQIDRDLAERHYGEHRGKEFYPPLIDFITSGPLVACVLEGDHAIQAIRILNGATDGAMASSGSVRGDLTLSSRENLVHASDSPETARREIALWFPGLA